MEDGLFRGRGRDPPRTASKRSPPPDARTKEVWEELSTLKFYIPNETQLHEGV